MSWSVLGYCWSFIVIVRRDPCRWRGYSTCPERNTAALKYRKLNAVAPEWPPKLANRLWIPGCALTKPLVACSQIRFLLFLSIIRTVFFPFQFASVWGPWLFPPWGELSVGGDRGWYECLGWKNGPTALGISLLAAGLCEREKGHFQAGEVSANISCQSDSGPQLE